MMLTLGGRRLSANLCLYSVTSCICLLQTCSLEKNRIFELSHSCGLKLKGVSVSTALHEEPYILFSTENKSMLCIKCFRDTQVWVNPLHQVCDCQRFSSLLHIELAAVCLPQGESDSLHWYRNSLRAGVWDVGPGCTGEGVMSVHLHIWHHE